MKTVICKDVFGNTREIPVEQLQFRVAIYGVIIRDNQVLLGGFRDGWTLPGGGLDIGESLDDAFVREIKEETGVIVERKELLHVSDGFHLHPNGDQGFHSIRLYFTGAYVSGEISTDGFVGHEQEHASAAQWFPLEEADALKYWGHRNTLELIRRAAALPQA